MLLLQPGRTVSKDRLIACAWPGDAPPTAGDLVAAYVSRLRKALAPAGRGLVLRAVRPGFRAEIDDASVSVDVHAFQALLRRAAQERESYEHELASAHLQQALELWAGYTEAMVGLDSAWLREKAAELAASRLDAIELLGELYLASDKASRAVALLAEPVRLHPGRERLAAALVDALVASDRHGHAADVAARAAAALVKRGQEPGPALRRAQSAALAPSAPEPPRRRAGPRNQLPADTGAFTGREAELDQLLELVADHGGADGEKPRAGQVPIAAIDGMGGIGKSALAVRFAHRVAERFPDGQLFADLRGHTPGHPPRAAREVLEALLLALGLSPDQIPEGEDARSALLRGRLTGTRTLIVLDNARNEAQIRPLLPGAEDCLVVVTSRRRLKGLDDAVNLSLGLLPEPAAAALFRRVAGPGRVAAAEADVSEVVDLCGRLPLALRIAAALLRHRPSWSVSHLAARLRDLSGRVDALTDGERDLSVVFDESYRHLPDELRLLYRRLGLHAGDDLDVFASAALADLEPSTAGRRLEELVDHNLLSEPSPGRYRMHDLVRIHALGRADADETPASNGTTARRALDYYLALAQAANRYLARRALAIDIHTSDPPRFLPEILNREQAVECVRDEFANLSAYTESARTRGLADYLVSFSAALHGYLYVNGPWAFARDLHTAAAEAAARSGDELGQATALHTAGRVRRLLGDYRGAAADFTAALEIYRRLGHEHGQAHALDALGRISWLTADYPAAIEAFERALERYRRAGDTIGEAGSLNGLGRVCRLTGNPAQALDLHARALRLCTQRADPIGQATALNDLGCAREQTGDLAGAFEAQESALALYTKSAHVLGQANAWHALGRLQRLTGRTLDGEGTERHALELYESLGHILGQANAWVELAHACGELGHPAAAEQALRRALALFGRVGDRRGEAEVHDLLSEIIKSTNREADVG